MSTILSRRNITVQSNIEMIECIEDMKTFLKTLHNTYEAQLPIIHRSFGTIPSTEVFYKHWNLISNQVNLNRFINSYNISGWECRTTNNTTYIYIPTSPAQRNIFSLVSLTNNRYALVISENGMKDLKFNKICKILKCIEGVEMLSRISLDKNAAGYDVARFEIDFDKL